MKTVNTDKRIDIEDMFEDMVNETNNTLKIGTLEYLPGAALKKLDPIAFRQGVLEYLDLLVKDRQVTEIDGDYYWTHDIEEAV